MRTLNRCLALLSGAVAVLAFAGCGTANPQAGTSPTPSTSASAIAPTPTAEATPTPTAQATTQPTAAPTPAPTPTALPAGFVCSGTPSGGSASARSRVADVRVGEQNGFDRFVVEFDGPIPSYTVKLQPNSTFTLSPKGTDVTLAGSAGVLLTMQPIADWTSYSAATAFAPGFTYLKEARQVENFEAVQQWGLGVAAGPCVHVFTLDTPYRLVVDLTTAS